MSKDSFNIKNTGKNSADRSHDRPAGNAGGRHLWSRIFKITAIFLASLAGFIILILCGLSVYLTPERLTRLVNEKGSEYLNADIHARNVSYTLWRSFPRFDVRSESIEIISRSLNSLPPEIRKTLPENADSLASLKNFSGSINVVDIFLNRYVIHDVRIDGLSLNLVAYNDSVNNYNILPASNEKLKKIPYISAHLISLNNPGGITYYSAASKTRASVDLSRLVLEHKKGRDSDNLYHLALNGNIDASSDGLTILNGFPFNLAGDLRLLFNPFRVRIIDYAINLGEIKSKLSMSLGMGDDPSIESFDYKISSVNLMSLLGYLPKDFVPSLQGVKSDIIINASARMTSVWSFSSNNFPSMKVDFSSPAGTLDYTVAAGNGSSSAGPTNYPLAYSSILASFIFNGENPEKSYIDIAPINISTDGIEVDFSAKIKDLTGSPLVDGNISVNSDLKRTLDFLIPALPMNLAGDLTLNSNFKFNLASLSKEGLKEGIRNLDLTGDFLLSNCVMNSADRKMTAKIDNLSGEFSQQTALLNENFMEDPNSSLTMHINNATGSLPQGRFTASGVDFSTSNYISGDITPAQFRRGVPLYIRLAAAHLAFRDSQNKIGVEAEGFLIDDTFTSDRLQSSEALLADGLEAGARRISLREADNRFILSRPMVALSVIGMDDADKLLKDYATPTPPTPAADIAGAGQQVAHTPELLSFELPENVRQYLNELSFRAQLKAARVDLHTPGGDRSNHLANVDLTLDNDDVYLTAGSMMLEKTRGRLNGKISNLKKFLLLPPEESNPLDIDLTVNIDTININTLAKTYAMAKGGIEKIPTHTEVTPDDSIALLIPRNINARIEARSKETIYTNLHLYNLLADVRINHGDMKIPTLSIDSDFGNASLNIDYDSSDINHLNFSVKGEMNNIVLVNFYKNFRAMMQMMPEMKNLTGTLSIGLDASGEIFPDMYLNVPSLMAELNLGGRSLKLHQSPFIRKITRMMLINTDDDIHIKDIGIHAGIRDNLLQLDPFNFEFDRYTLHALGINNFNGNLYYHLAVMKSPVPFPFSINIEGHFHHPELRFGGPDYDLKRSEEVSSQIQENNNMNIVKMLRSFGGTAIKKAAEAAGNPNFSL